jgi:hypothetical protein
MHNQKGEAEMGWTAGTSNESDSREGGAASQATGATNAGAKRTGSKRGIVWILAGLLVTGVAAGWSWLRRLPKD